MKRKKNEAKRARKPAARSTPLKPQHGAKVTKPTSKSKSTSTTHSTIPTVPFTPTDAVLLIGEGDFSFSNAVLTASLTTPPGTLTATTNESEATTLLKYPQAESHITHLRTLAHRVVFSVDATKPLPKALKQTTYDAILFNFPHTGGLTTAVDRQVRANQQLLLSFLTNVKPHLSPGGVVAITLFDGQPYAQWDVRGLAKVTGYSCRRSFKFDAGLYPGYRHVRTIGNRDREGDWKGEERGARTYLFEVAEGGKDGGAKRAKRQGKKQTAGKKKAGESSDDDD
ncbi:hypothetical protein Dda_1046 [Drechslerella dactyloides]|uniref:25S rRNA (uridine-N(3))-methyltransferase BMT5-like domain-containing protein n=1 Tax=Drechslerella dactyloides TaxID=74499 RepID=A0AAD6NPG4_DREDA|nr:hypothetical protein Dda_1046 [Drechslerella dactyloides]